LAVLPKVCDNGYWILAFGKIHVLRYNDLDYCVLYKPGDALAPSGFLLEAHKLAAPLGVYSVYPYTGFGDSWREILGRLPL
jgi:hypothetical protein